MDLASGLAATSVAAAAVAVHGLACQRDSLGRRRHRRSAAARGQRSACVLVGHCSQDRGSHAARGASSRGRGRTSRGVFDRFREDAITAVYCAQEEAMRQGASVLDTEMVLYGIVAEDGRTGVAKAVLLVKGITREAVGREVRLVHDQRPHKSHKAKRGGNTLAFTDSTKQLFDLASSETEGEVGAEHLLLAIAHKDMQESGASQVLTTLGLSGPEIRGAVAEALLKAEGEQQQLATVGAGGGSAKMKLEEVAVDLTQMARDGKLDTCVGRDEQLERLVQILLRRKKNNACLVGPPGVGKTAVAEGFAQRVADGKVPKRLRDKRVFALDLGLLVAGTKYRGEFEERLKAVIDEVKEAQASEEKQSICLFIDEIHQLVGAGVAGPDSSMDAANMLKPALARGELQVIGATTTDEYVKHIEKDAALERRFQKVLCEEPSVEDTVDILEGLRPAYEDFHNVSITPDALSAAARWSQRYLTERFLPDKAIDLIDEAGSLVQMREGEEDEEAETDVEDDLSPKPLVTADDVARVLSIWSGVPVERLEVNEATRLMKLEDTLASSVVGQHDAVSALARAVRRSRSGLSGGNRPIASFLFAGPTGVGKTELCKVLASEYYLDEKAMVRLDMSEYSESFSVSRLMGSPPGYVGFDDPRSGQLTELVRRRPYSVVVFDELEKAHSEVLSVLLQVLEDGRLTDGKGRTVSFCNCILIMTSNLGSREILQQADGVGEDYRALRATVEAEIQKRFAPEFLNRIDELIVFKSLQTADLQQVVQLQLQDAAKRASRASEEAAQMRGDMDSSGGLKLHWTPALEELVLDSGDTAHFGARPLRRAVQRLFEDPVAELLVSGDLDGDATVDVDSGGQVVVRCGGKELRPSMLQDLATDVVFRES